MGGRVGKPEQDQRRQAKVSVLPCDLLRFRMRVVYREAGTPRVQHDRVHVPEFRGGFGLPVGAVLDAARASAWVPRI